MKKRMSCSVWLMRPIIAPSERRLAARQVGTSRKAELETNNRRLGPWPNIRKSGPPRTFIAAIDASRF
jgi:hypothetical protein